ncbi:MAG: hypothetical protein M9894_34070 [Planctomycetes bacterium]|nr:hypothetical protein [Planctomycetota bacterium]
MSETSAVETMQQQIGPQAATPQAPAPSDAEEAVQALAWCEEHQARVIWQRAADEGRPRCTIEILAPGSSWNLLRGRGSDFLGAYRAARGKWSTTTKAA